MKSATLDGFSVFKAIGEHRASFAAIEHAVHEAGVKLLIAALKRPTLTLEDLIATRRALGAHDFGRLIDTLGVADLKKVLKKADPHSALLKVGDDEEMRRHVNLLAASSVTPSAKPSRPVNPPRGAKATKTASSKAVWPTAMSAKPPRAA